MFGESDNDRAALVELFRALRPDLTSVSVETRREPLILMKGASRPSTRRKTTNRIAALVRAELVSRPVAAVIAHEDCDAIEPAHEVLATMIESGLAAAGVPNPIAATPAWDIEAWWMLFPQALQMARPCWATVDYDGRHVGEIEHTKEVLRRGLRPVAAQARARCPDYAESDSIAIARNIRARSLHAQPRGISGSFQRFADRVRTLKVG